MALREAKIVLNRASYPCCICHRDARRARKQVIEPSIGADWEWHFFRIEGDAAVDPKNFIRLKVEEEVAP